LAVPTLTYAPRGPPPLGRCAVPESSFAAPAVVSQTLFFFFFDRPLNLSQGTRPAKALATERKVEFGPVAWPFPPDSRSFHPCGPGSTLPYGTWTAKNGDLALRTHPWSARH